MFFFFFFCKQRHFSTQLPSRAQNHEINRYVTSSSSSHPHSIQFVICPERHNDAAVSESRCVQDSCVVFRCAMTLDSFSQEQVLSLNSHDLDTFRELRLVVLCNVPQFTFTWRFLESRSTLCVTGSHTVSGGVSFTVPSLGTPYLTRPVFEDGHSPWSLD